MRGRVGCEGGAVVRTPPSPWAAAADYPALSVLAIAYLNLKDQGELSRLADCLKPRDARDERRCERAVDGPDIDDEGVQGKGGVSDELGCPQRIELVRAPPGGGGTHGDGP